MDDEVQNSVVKVDNKTLRGSRSATPVHDEYFESEIGSDDDSGWETDLLDDSELSRSLCRSHDEFRIASEARIKQGNLAQLAVEDMHVEQNICRMCRKMVEIFINSQPTRETHVQHFYFYLLYQQTLAAAHQGCALCAMFVGQASMGHRDLLTELPGVNGANWEDPPHERLVFTLRNWVTRPDRDTRAYWGFYFISYSHSRGYGVKSPMMIIRHARLDDLRPSSIDSNGLSLNRLMSLARNWLAKCRKHPACSKRSAENTSLLPTRLISIRQNPIRLCSSKTRPTQEYATLSHCWGINSETLLKLTRDTIEEFHNEIPVQRLSRTFRQAIDIALDLGIDYIWIDSLCIIQDDDNDWKEQAALMHGVYGNSFLNIAASDANDGGKGCFPERKKSFQTFHTVRVKLGEDYNSRAYSIIPTSVFRALAKTVLASRGWCLQERLLAPRTLHFGYRQLFWECDTRHYCECFPRGIPVALRSHLFENTILHIYTRSAFTKPSDRLIALSGIIRKIEIETSSTCYFGIWRKDFEYNLMWTVRKLTVLENYRAPSWSWASIDGPYDEAQTCPHAKFTAHFLHADKQPAGCDAEENPCYGQLKMICQTMIELVYSDTKQPIQTHSIPQYNYSEWSLKSAPETLKGDARWSCDSYPNDTSIYFLPIWFYNGIYGLLLASTGKKGQYRRVASFTVMTEQPEILLERYRADESAYESCIDDKAYPDERWVITII